MSGSRESKISFRRNMKVRIFLGTRIQDMYYYLVPLVCKRPDKIILHVGTNDAPHIKTDVMLDKSKSVIWKTQPFVKTILSAPTIWVNKGNVNVNVM